MRMGAELGKCFSSFGGGAKMEGTFLSYVLFRSCSYVQLSLWSSMLIHPHLCIFPLSNHPIFAPFFINLKPSPSSTTQPHLTDHSKGPPQRQVDFIHLQQLLPHFTPLLRHYGNQRPCTFHCVESQPRCVGVV